MAVYPYNLATSPLDFFADGEKIALAALSCENTSSSSVVAGTGVAEGVACALATRYMLRKSQVALNGRLVADITVRESMDGFSMPFSTFADSLFGYDVGYCLYKWTSPYLLESVFKRGDLIFWHTPVTPPENANVVTHVGIYLGQGFAISNSSSQGKIRIHEWNYGGLAGYSVIGLCRIWSGIGLASWTVGQGNIAPNALTNGFGTPPNDYTTPNGYNTGETSGDFDDYTASAQDRANNEKRSNTIKCECIGDYRLTVKNNSTVLVRGVGTKFGGKYYVKGTKHTIEKDSPYKVSLDLVRNAFGDNTTGQDPVTPPGKQDNPPNTGQNNNTTNDNSYGYNGNNSGIVLPPVDLNTLNIPNPEDLYK